MFGKKYYKIDELLNLDIVDGNPFFFSNERYTKEGLELIQNGRPIVPSKHIGRYYVVLESVDDFIKNRQRYPNSHELLLVHPNFEDDDYYKGGRLVFDFDIKPSEYSIPADFKTQVEEVIMHTLQNNYDVDLDNFKLTFVWSSSNYPKSDNKFSKHLTVKGIYMRNWIKMTKIFYRRFAICWDNTYSWIESAKIIDFQIAKKNQTLRMVGSTKINKNTPITLDDPRHSFEDSLIRCYNPDDPDTINLSFTDLVKTDVNDLKDYEDKISHKNIVYFGLSVDNQERKRYEGKMPKEIYKRTRKLLIALDYINDNFEIGDPTSEKSIFLKRVNPSKCIQCNRTHESQNAYIFVGSTNGGKQLQIVYFGCYVYCQENPGKKKIKKIGSFKTPVTTIDPIQMLANTIPPKAPNINKTVKVIDIDDLEVKNNEFLANIGELEKKYKSVNNLPNSSLYFLLGYDLPFNDMVKSLERNIPKSLPSANSNE